MLIGLRRIAQRQPVRNDERRSGLANVDEIAQMTVVGLDVGLTGSDALAFEPEETPVKHDLTLLAQWVRSPRVLGYEDADHAKLTVKGPLDTTARIAPLWCLVLAIPTEYTSYLFICQVFILSHLLLYETKIYFSIYMLRKNCKPSLICVLLLMGLGASLPPLVLLGVLVLILMSFVVLDVRHWMKWCHTT
jgi:hypothetical protein